MSQYQDALPRFRNAHYQWLVTRASIGTLSLPVVPPIITRLPSLAARVQHAQFLQSWKPFHVVSDALRALRETNLSRRSFCPALEIFRNTAASRREVDQSCDLHSRIQEKKKMGHGTAT